MPPVATGISPDRVGLLFGREDGLRFIEVATEDVGGSLEECRDAGIRCFGGLFRYGSHDLLVAAYHILDVLTVEGRIVEFREVGSDRVGFP